MGRKAQRVLDEVGTPPDDLGDQIIGSIVKPRGNSLYEVSVPESHQSKAPEPVLLVSMPPKFRNTVFVKRGGFVVVELYDDIDSKVHGEISYIVTDKREWQRYPYWPAEYRKEDKIDLGLSDDEDESDEEYEEEGGGEEGEAN